MDSPSKAVTLPVCPKTLKAYKNTQIRDASNAQNMQKIHHNKWVI
jgi:hypothetical protein